MRYRYVKEFSINDTDIYRVHENGDFEQWDIYKCQWIYHNFKFDWYTNMVNDAGIPAREQEELTEEEMFLELI